MDWLRNQMDARGMTQRELASVAGMTEQMFTNVVAGRRKFSAREVDAIRRAFGYTLPEDRPTGIEVVGRVGAGNEVYLVDENEGNGGIYRIARPEWLPAQGIAAAEIQGGSAEPWALPGDIIFWKRNAMAVFQEDIGRPVVAATEDGRVMLKRLASGSERGLWNLASINQSYPTEYDVRLLWAARVLPPLAKDQVVLLP